MNIVKKYQSPIVIPSNSISQNWVSKDCFDLNKTFSINFKLNHTNPSDKELSFGIFLIDSPDTKVFNATTARGTVLEYASKGELAEQVKELPTVKDKNNNICDFLLDHVYPLDINGLIKNNKPFNGPNMPNPNIVTVVFDAHKHIIKNYKDYDSNDYFPKYSLKDYNTGEIVDISTYENPVFIQVLKEYFLLDFPLNILNVQNHTIRLTFENFGQSIKIDLLNPYESNYTNIGSREFLNLDIALYNNIRLGYSLTSPTETYDSSLKADFNIVNFHIQGKLK